MINLCIIGFCFNLIIIIQTQNTILKKTEEKSLLSENEFSIERN